MRQPVPSNGPGIAPCNIAKSSLTGCHYGPPWVQREFRSLPPPNMGGRRMLLPTPSPDVIHKVVGDGAVLLSTKDEVYYGLNAVGTCIWERLPPVLAELDDLCASVSNLYPDVDPQTIRVDVQELIDDLLAHGLLCPPDPHE